MFELFAFVAFILALSAFAGGRKTAERLGAEIAALKAEVARLKASSGEGIHGESTSEELAAAPELPVEPETVEDTGGDLAASAAEGARIFGGEEKAADIEVEETIVASTEAPQPVPAAPVRPKAWKAVSARVGPSGSVASRSRSAASSWSNIRSMPVS